MSERYVRVFELPKNLYLENAPVVISAGALLKDRQTGKMIAQLKFKNITNKTIKALKISVLPLDTVGDKLDGEVFFEYLDLSASRSEVFGAKTPIKLPNNSTRGFTAAVKEVVFTDNSVWSEDGVWTSLCTSESLFALLKDSELVKQYKLEFSDKCENQPVEDRDIWICSCGEINKNSESTCFKCECYLEELKNVDLEVLKEKKHKRLIEEAKEAAIKQKEMRKKGIILGGIVLLLIILISSCSSYNKKLEKYQYGISLMSSSNSEDFDKGVRLLEELGGFKDSKEQIYLKASELALKPNSTGVELLMELGDYKESKETLYKAASLYMKTNYQKSIEIYEYLGDYKDSKDKKAQTPYLKAEEYFKKGSYSLAYTAYEKAGDYKDSKEKMNKAYLYDAVLSVNYSKTLVSVNPIMEKLGLKDMTEEEIKGKIVGSWYSRKTSTPGEYFIFNGDGTYIRKYYSSKQWKEKEDTKYTWTVENNELVMVTSGKNYKGEDTVTKTTYKLVTITDGVILAYNPSNNNVSFICLLKDSEFANKMLEKNTQYRIEE